MAIAHRSRLLLVFCFAAALPVSAHGQSDLQEKIKSIDDFTGALTKELASMQSAGERLIKAEQEQAVGQVSKRKFEGAFRAGRAIKAGTNVGVTISKLVDHVQALATEIEILKGQTSNPAERRLLAIYTHSLAIYGSTARIWSAKIQFGQPGTELSQHADTIIQSGWSVAAGGIEIADSLYLGRKPKSPSK